jgi:hypothetical protein
MEVKLKLTADEHKDLVSYCNLNDLLISSVVKDSFTTGFNIERYGLLNSGVSQVKQVEKEVIVEKRVEIPVEVIKEVVKIEYVEVEKPIEKIVEKVIEKPIEIIKEVPVERVVEKIVEITKEVPVEKVVIQEVIKEIAVEKVIEKEVKVSDDTQINELLKKIHQLESLPPKIVEVIKEIPVERVVIEEKRVEVPIEKIVEVIKEVVVEKNSGGVDKSKFDALQQTVMKLRQETLEKDRMIKEYEKTISEIQKFQDNKQASFMRGSNLDDKLYK